LLAERVPPPSKQPVGAALVFGREDRGLSNDELLQAGCLLHIPAARSYPSINLANAVAVVVQTLWTLRLNLDAGNSDLLNKAPRTVATRDAFEATLADAEALLLEVGFLYPHTARARMAKLRQLLLRAEASADDVALLRGMVRQLRWASRHGSSDGPG